MSVKQHRAKCNVCNHPDCKMIEDLYMNYTEIKVLDKLFGLTQKSMYRHVVATDLEGRRNAYIGQGLTRLGAMAFSQLEAQPGQMKSPETVALKVMMAQATMEGMMKSVNIDLTAEMQGKTQAEMQFFLNNGHRWPTAGELEMGKASDEAEGRVQ